MKDGSQNLYLESLEDQRDWYEYHMALEYQRRAYAAVAYANQHVRELQIKLGLKINFNTPLPWTEEL